MERKLMLTVLLSSLVILGLAISTGVIAAATPGKESLCLTEGCILEAAHLIKRMDLSVNPCDDFYHYACGRYIKEEELPADKMEIDPLSLTGEVASKQVKKIIIETKRKSELRPFVLLKKFYESCMNTSAIEQNNVDKMKEIFSQLGGFPALEGNSWKESDWIEITKKLRQKGYENAHFISIDNDINIKNSSEYVISVDQLLNEEIAASNLKDGLGDHLVQTYASLLTDFVVLFGVDKDFATKEVNDVIGFRAKLANISSEKPEHTKQILAATATDIATLQKEYPAIQWLDYINGALGVPGKTVTETNRVLVVAPNYVKEFQHIIANTPKRVQINHALLQVVRSSIQFLPKSFRDREHKFMSAVTGVAKALPRWDICVAQVTSYFDLAADAMYVRTYVDKQARNDVTEMVNLIRHELIKILNEVDWMDSVTRKEAIEKAESIKPYIAYPDELLDDKELENYYSEIKFDSSNILDMINEAKNLKRNQALRFFGGPVVKSHWTTRLAATTNNAVYDPQTNSIQIPSGIMQNEFYGKDRPKYMNYGGLGMVIGHEITHGFDNTGREFNKNGDEVPWWEAGTLDAYTSKSKCFIQQYSNFTAAEVNLTVNGDVTLGENIADNGGMKEAYLAYLEWVKKNGEELPLPGINHTPKQLYWIAVANAWCTKVRPSYLEQAMLQDEHSPNQFRILGGLQNIKHFAEDFNCFIGSNMNPEKKCQIW